MIMADKVYCGKCKWHRQKEGLMGVRHLCYYPAKTDECHNAVLQWVVPAECSKENKDNDCPNYEPKPSQWRRLCKSLTQ